MKPVECLHENLWSSQILWMGFGVHGIPAEFLRRQHGKSPGFFILSQTMVDLRQAPWTHSVGFHRFHTCLHGIHGGQ